MLEALFTLLKIYLLLIPFGQLLRIPTSVPGVIIQLSDVVMVVISILGFFYWLKHRVNLFKLPLSYPIIIFAAISLTSLFIGAVLVKLPEFFVGASYWIRWMAYAHLYFLVSHLLTQSPSHRHQLLSTLKVSGVTLAIFGFIQYFLFPNLNPIHTQGWDLHLYRLTGPIFDPGFTGLLLLFTLILIFTNPRDLKLKSWNSLLALFIYMALVLTYSRATYLALVVSAVGYLIVKRSFKIATIFTAILLITAVILPRPSGEGGNLARTSTVNFRVTNWQQSLRVARDHPIFGVGFNLYRYAQPRYEFLTPSESESSHSAAGVDNSFLFVLATTGVVGLMSFVWLWFLVLKVTLPNLLSSKYQLTSILIIISALVHSQFHNTLFYPPIMAWIWITLGLSHGSHNTYHITK